MTRYEQLERLKVEAERWLAAVANSNGEGHLLSEASRGIRELIDKAALIAEPGPSVETLRWRAMQAEVK